MTIPAKGHQDNVPTVPPARIRGIDGLRALAVLGVMFFHADWIFAKGGFFGVDLFFVISGFLITRFLLAEVEEKHKISLRAFYMRRARRILPALAGVIGGTALAAGVLASDALPQLRTDSLASALFISNWYFIAQQLSYFEYIGRQPLLQHLWSLAIEEQFYLAWPLFVLALMSLGGRRLLGVTATVLALASAVWMGTLAKQLGYPEVVDISRVYFGTDTHAFGLLSGAMLAAYRFPTREKHRGLAAVSLWSLSAFLGIVAIGGTLFLFSQIGENHRWLYPWAFAVSSLLSMPAIIACLIPGPVGTMLDIQPLRWIGERSYGIYLWHWPIFMLTRPGIDVDLSQGETFFIRCALTFGIAAVSYRFIEAPILGRRLRPLAVTSQFSFGVISSLICVAIFILSLPLRNVSPSSNIESSSATSSTNSTPSPVSDVDQPSVEFRHVGQLTVVGDSVVLGARRAIEHDIEGATVYATVGWQAADVLGMLKRIQAAGELQPKVLIHLGTNGYITEKQLREMLELLRDRERVIVMNSRVPRRWMLANNDLLAKVVPQYPNAVLVDWHSLSNVRSEYFVQDGVHLTVPGARAFVDAIVAAGNFVAVPLQNKPRPLLSPILPQATEPEDYAPSLVRHIRPIAPDSFWEAIASCETGNNWQNDGEYAGGLGIYVGTWIKWGGQEFAPTPDLATQGQQIIVANRISTQGWLKPNNRFVAPVGFSGWGCLKTVGRPMLLMFTSDSLFSQHFRWLQRGQAVRDLQLMLGLPVDGVYRDRTVVRHRDILIQRGLPVSLSGNAPARTPNPTPTTTPVTTAPPQLVGTTPTIAPPDKTDDRPTDSIPSSGVVPDTPPEAIQRARTK